LWLTWYGTHVGAQNIKKVSESLTSHAEQKHDEKEVSDNWKKLKLILGGM